MQQESSRDKFVNSGSQMQGLKRERLRGSMDEPSTGHARLRNRAIANCGQWHWLAILIRCHSSVVLSAEPMFEVMTSFVPGSIGRHCSPERLKAGGRVTARRS